MVQIRIPLLSDIQRTRKGGKRGATLNMMRLSQHTQSSIYKKIHRIVPNGESKASPLYFLHWLRFLDSSLMLIHYLLYQPPYLPPALHPCLPGRVPAWSPRHLPAGIVTRLSCLLSGHSSPCCCSKLLHAHTNLLELIPVSFRRDSGAGFLGLAGICFRDN